MILFDYKLILLYNTFINNSFALINDIKVAEMINIFTCGELDYIIKGLPDAEVEKHLNRDADYIFQILAPVKDMIDFSTLDIEYIIGMTRLIFFSVSHEKQIGTKVIGKVIRSQFENIVAYIFKI